MILNHVFLVISVRKTDVSQVQNVQQLMCGQVVASGKSL